MPRARYQVYYWWGDDPEDAGDTPRASPGSSSPGQVQRPNRYGQASALVLRTAVETRTQLREGFSIRGGRRNLSEGSRLGKVSGRPRSPRLGSGHIQPEVDRRLGAQGSCTWGHQRAGRS